jgi:hypothetical protein
MGVNTFFILVLFSYSGALEEVAYKRSVEFGGLSMDFRGDLQTYVKSAYYPSLGAHGTPLTFVNIGDCFAPPEITPFTADVLPTCTTLPRNSVGDYITGSAVYAYAALFNQTEPTVFNASHVTDPSWLRYPTPGPMRNTSIVWGAESASTIMHTIQAEVIQYTLSGSIFDIHDHCRQTGLQGTPLVEESVVGEDSILYTFEMSINWLYPQVFWPPAYRYECSKATYGVAVSQSVNAMVSFTVTENTFASVKSVEYETCSACKDRTDSDKYFHTCTEGSQAYRKKVIIDIDTPAGESPLGISNPDDISAANNGCYGFPQGATWTRETIGDKVRTRLTLYTECLSIEKYFMYDCSRFNTCDVNGDGHLLDDDHAQFDYGIVVRLKRCGPDHGDCLSSSYRTHTQNQCDNHCDFTVTSNDVDVTMDISVEHGECPRDVTHGQVVGTCPQLTTAVVVDSGFFLVVDEEEKDMYSMDIIRAGIAKSLGVSVSEVTVLDICDGACAEETVLPDSIARPRSQSTSRIQVLFTVESSVTSTQVDTDDGFDSTYATTVARLAAALGGDSPTIAASIIEASVSYATPIMGNVVYEPEPWVEPDGFKINTSTSTPTTPSPTPPPVVECDIAMPLTITSLCVALLFTLITYTFMRYRYEKTNRRWEKKPRLVIGFKI